jgi:hypothetical protein
MVPQLVLAVVALSATAPTAAAAQRVATDFGHDWRYRVGDDPAGPGIGAFDIANGFAYASNCTGMVEKQLYHPGGNKNAGQNFTGCAVACSYDARCTTYRDQRLGGATASAAGTAPLPRSAPPAARRPRHRRVARAPLGSRATIMAQAARSTR